MIQVNANGTEELQPLGWPPFGSIAVEPFRTTSTRHGTNRTVFVHLSFGGLPVGQQIRRIVPVAVLVVCAVLGSVEIVEQSMGSLPGLCGQFSFTSLGGRSVDQAPQQ